MGWTRAQVLNVAKRTGFPVVEAWSGHNKGNMGTVYGPMLHHTGSKGSGDYPTLRVVRDGRAGLENSLSMYGLGKSGTIYCINNYISWHAGAGNWNGVTDGNGHFAGIEAESSGNGTDWTPQQIEAYKRLVASILIETGRDTNWMPMHKEYALPKGRKPDPAGIEIVSFKKDVEKYRLNPRLMGSGGVDEMTPEQQAWLNQRINDLAGHITNAKIEGKQHTTISRDELQRYLTQRLDGLSAAVAKGAADVDEAELAALLAPALADRVSSLTDADLAAVAAKVNDERDARERARLAE